MQSQKNNIDRELTYLWDNFDSKLEIQEKNIKTEMDDNFEKKIKLKLQKGEPFFSDIENFIGEKVDVVQDMIKYQMTNISRIISD